MAVFEEIYMNYSEVQSYISGAKTTMELVEESIQISNDTVKYIKDNSEGEVVTALDGMWESLKNFVTNLVNFFTELLEALAYAIEQHQNRDKEGSALLLEANAG